MANYDQDCENNYQETRNVWADRENNREDDIAPVREKIGNELKKMMIEMGECVDKKDYEKMLRISKKIANYKKEQKSSRWPWPFNSSGTDIVLAIAKELTLDCGSSNQVWACKHCTLRNDGSTLNCCVCNMNRGMPADNQQHQLLVNATQNNERQQYQEQYQAHRRTELALWACDTCASENPAAAKVCDTCGQEREEEAVTGLKNIVAPKRQMPVHSPEHAHRRPQGEPQAFWSCGVCESKTPAADKTCGACGQEREGGPADNVNRMNPTPVASKRQMPVHSPEHAHRRPQGEPQAFWSCGVCESKTPAADKTCGACGQEREGGPADNVNRMNPTPVASKRQMPVHSPEHAHRRPQGEPQAFWSCGVCESKTPAADKTCGACGQEREGGPADNVNRMNPTPVKVRQQVTERVGTDEADVEEQTQPGTWKCPQCTFVNANSRPGCEVCAAPSPEHARKRVV